MRARSTCQACRALVAMTEEEHKRACLEAWKRSRDKRIALAQDLMAVRSTWNKAWPRWVVYDLKATIRQLEENKRKAVKAAEVAKRAHEAKQAVLGGL